MPVKRFCLKGDEEWGNLVTLDFNADHQPDVVWDLEKLPLPFPDNSFDEIHAYDVLEHTGQQGDWRFFFDQWSDFWRILRPSGLFYFISPSYKSMWAWGDPSHKRVLTSGSLLFLSQGAYEAQVGRTAMSDFRFYYKADFKPVYLVEDDKHLMAVLEAVKKESVIDA